MGTDKKPDITDVIRSSGAAYQITLERKKGDPLTIAINSRRNAWVWSQGTSLPKGEWNLTKAKELGKFLDGLLK